MQSRLVSDRTRTVLASERPATSHALFRAGSCLLLTAISRTLPPIDGNFCPPSWITSRTVDTCGELSVVGHVV